jgi:hypothetical protein
MSRPRKNKTTESATEPQLTSSVTETSPADQVTESVTAPPPSAGLPELAPLPEPSEEIFDAPRIEASQTSSGGEAYDPAIHESPPRQNARGTWARRRGGARRSTASHAADPQEAPTATSEDISLKLDATAALAAGMLFLAGEMAIGQCMKPDAEERAGITSAFRDYFQATGNVEIPPWLGLLGATAVYVGRRWSHPQFEEKRAKWFPKDEKLANE